MKRLALVLLLAFPAAPAMAQPECWSYRLDRSFGTYNVMRLQWHSFSAACVNIELVPTGNGIGLLVSCYYPTTVGYPALPFQNISPSNPCPGTDQHVTLLAWWWHDTVAEGGDFLFHPNRATTSLEGQPTGWMFAPTPIPPDTWTTVGLLAYRYQRVGRVSAPISPVYSAYLLVPARGWW